MGVTAIISSDINIAVSLLLGETTLPTRPALRFPHGVFRVRATVITGAYITLPSPIFGMYRIMTGQDDRIVGVPVLLRQSITTSPFVAGTASDTTYIAIIDEIFEAVDNDQLTFILTGIDTVTDYC